MKKQQSNAKLKDELGLEIKDIAAFFGDGEMGFLNNRKKEKYITALDRFYNHVKQTWLIPELQILLRKLCDMEVNWSRIAADQPTTQGSAKYNGRAYGVREASKELAKSIEQIIHNIASGEHGIAIHLSGVTDIQNDLANRLGAKNVPLTKCDKCNLNLVDVVHCDIVACPLKTCIS